MIYFRAIILPLLVCSQVGARGQQLQPGDRLPAYTFTEVLNYGPGHLRTDQVGGKAVILDFWTTYCAPCIAEMPYLDSLQHEFADQLQIIAVAMELKPTVNRLLDRLLSTGYLPFKALPFPKDTVLYQQLVGKGAPLGQHTWIDRHGVIRYFSQGRTLLSRENIRAFLAGAPVAALDSFVAERKKENEADRQASKTSTVPTPASDTSAIAASYLARWTPAMGHYIPTMIATHMPGQAIRVAGAPLSKLYYLAYGDTLVYYPVAGVANSYGKLWPAPIFQTHRRPAAGVADSNQLYYYYQSASDTITNAARLQAVMRAQLQAVFNYQVSIQTRPMPCWKLTVVDERKIPRSRRDQKPEDNSDVGQITLSGVGSDYLIYRLYSAFPLQPPIIDSTGGLSGLQISIAFDGSFEKLKAGLGAAGLSLTLSTTPMRVIVISD